jgi:hypothetical protein
VRRPIPVAWYQALKQERRRYEIGEPPYDDLALRDRKLICATSAGVKGRGLFPL